MTDNLAFQNLCTVQININLGIFKTLKFNIIFFGTQYS